ncbi:hypothetical protein BHE74_00014280 [Ensete ventricosum]|nr:hypothetical protein GW17_00026922 [Ensete ventricosum]RWW77557.1 hypothetical protein BHE74_00014280 [Ensete ventricosum]RZR75642.1 hypothetical protein BHM03_00000119 [Ensete ventricosum]
MPPTERTHLCLPRCLKRKRTIERNQAINGDGNINSVVRPAGAPSCHESYSSGVAWAWGACDQNVFLPFATTRRRWTIEGNDISTAACCFIQAKLQRMIAIPVVVPSQARLVGSGNDEGGSVFPLHLVQGISPIFFTEQRKGGEAGAR